MFRLPQAILTLAAMLVLAGAQSSRGQDLNPGGFLGLDGGSAGLPAFSFLKLPVSARNIGLSARTLTTDEEASIVHGNPACLAQVGDYYYSLSHAEILGEFRHEDMALAFPTPRWGSFGLGANLLSATAFEDARDIDEEPAQPTAYDVALSLAFGRNLLDNRMAAGARLDLIRGSIDQTAAHGYAFSFGALLYLVQDWRLGFGLHNLSHGVRYGGADSPIEPLPLSLGLEVGKPLLGSRWSAHAGFNQSNESILKYYAGGEFRLWKHLLLRMGWDGSTQDRELGGFGGFAAGTGVKYDRLTLDYGFKSLGPIGAYHALTLNYSRKARFRDADEILLEKALVEQRKGKYLKALGLARKAVAANPYNFKAQALAKQLEIELDRLDETAFSLYFTGGTEGYLTPHWRDGKSLGGLARRKTKLLELQGAGGKSLALDAGNLTHPSSLQSEERYVYAAYAQMPYDAVNVGAEELVLGPEAWSGNLPWLSTQQPLDRIRKGMLAEKEMTLKGGLRVRVMGALDPGGSRAVSVGGSQLEAVADALRRRIGPPEGKPRILVLLLQGGLASARRVAALVPELDVIILGGESQALGSPMRAGQTLICSPGRGGTHVGNLTLMLHGKGGGIRSFRHHLIPLDATVNEDEEIRKLLAPVTIDPNKFVIDEYDEDYRAQVMAYVHSVKPPIGGQGAGGRIFLRDLRSGRDYAMPSATALDSRPILGYGKNRMAFLGADSEDGPREVYAVELGTGRLDTLTRAGGRALDIRWILGNNALLAAYGPESRRDLYRIDPWSREVRNLGDGRFGDVRGFDIDKTGDHLAIMGESGGQSTLWVTSMKMEEPLPVAADRGFLGPPRWNPQGDRLAFLSLSEGKDGDRESGELRIFDFHEKKLIPVTMQSRVRDFSWSADGSRIFYVAGVNLLDINEYHLDSLVLRKATNGGSGTNGGAAGPAMAGGPGAESGDPSPRSEENPFPKVIGGRDGLLFEAATEGRRRILWVDLKTREEKVLVDSAGYNFLR